MNKQENYKNTPVLGCDSMLIITPETPQWRRDALEPYAATILGYDGRELRIFKMLNVPRPLPFQALRHIAEIAPRAEFSKFPMSFDGAAKQSIHRPRQYLLDELKAAQCRINGLLGMLAASLQGIQRVCKPESRPPKRGKEQPNSQKVEYSLPKVNKAARSIKRTVSGK